MTFTPRTAIEFGFGLVLVIAAVVMGLNRAGSGGLNDLLLAVLSLGGILIMAHAIWLMRQREG
jgi:glucose dehydrogenase